MPKTASQRPGFIRRSSRNEARNAGIKAMYERGVPASEIAAKVGCSYANVYLTLKRMGVTIRSRGEGRRVAAARRARLEAIRAAAVRRFGHQVAPAPVMPPGQRCASSAPPPNDWDEDDLLDSVSWEELS